MTRKVARLPAADLDRIPVRCRGCLFWELGHPRPFEPDGEDDNAPVRKEAWWAGVELEAGPVGRYVLVEGTAAGYCVLGPRRVFARRPVPVPHTSGDALLLATAWVEPAFRGAGLGRLLVQAAVKEALQRDLHAVEAYGDRRFREATCMLPCTWLLHEGFAVHREHPRYPLLRLDVHATVRWAEEIESAVEHVLGRLGRRAPARVPEGP